jgi:hypothetical protein
LTELIPADLNGLVRFAERRNLVSARVPPHFNWPVGKGKYLFFFTDHLCFSHRKDLEQLPFMWEAEVTQDHDMTEIPGFAGNRSSD